MTPELITIIESLGRAFGLGGLAILVTLILFRTVLRQKIFPTLTPEQAFKLLTLVVSGTSVITLFGIGAWIFAILFESHPLDALNTLGVPVTTEAFVKHVRDNNVPIVELFLKAGSPPNETIPQDSYQTLLQFAILYEHSEMVDLLLYHGADPNRMGGSYNAQQRTPLVYCIEFTDSTIVDVKQCVKKLLGAGAEPNMCGKNNETPLFALASTGLVGNLEEDYQVFLETAQLLLESGADPNNDGGSDNHPLLSFPCVAHEFTQLLIDNDVDVNYQTSEGVTALMECASSYYPDSHVQYIGRFHNGILTLLKAGADPNLQDEHGNTALMDATSNPDMVELLLKHAAEVDQTDENETTALLKAARDKAVPRVPQLLLKAGANAHATDTLGNSSFHLLMADAKDFDGREDDFKAWLTMLVASGLSTNATNKAGQTPFLIYCRSGSPDLLQFLEASGVDMAGADTRGRNALHYFSALCTRGSWIQPFGGSDNRTFKFVVRWFSTLIESGVNLNAQDNDHNTPLMFLATQGSYCPWTPQLLVAFTNASVDISLTNKDGLTAAELIRNRDLFNQFLEAGLVPTDKVDHLKKNFER